MYDTKYVEGWIEGDSKELWIEDYNCRVSSQVTVIKEDLKNKHNKKILCVIDTIDGDHRVCAYVRKSKIRFDI